MAVQRNEYFVFARDKILFLNAPRKWLGTCEHAWHPSPEHPVAFELAFPWFPFPGLLVLLVFDLGHFR